MAKPSGWDSFALNGNGKNGKSSNEDHLMSWYGDEDHGDSLHTDNHFQTPLSFDNSDPGLARQRALDEFLYSKRQEFRQARLNEEPVRKDVAPAGATQAALTNLEITYSQPEVQTQPQIKQQAEQQQLTIAQTKDMGFAALRQLEGPSSASSQWMMSYRPDLFQQFQSTDNSLQIGSKPDGTVFEVLTTPQGYSRMLTAKGSTTVEIIADRQGNELFKHSGRQARETTALSA